MMNSEQEIESLLDRYNQEEKEQGQRLGRIFYLLKRRQGYRKIEFNNGEMWSSCWEPSDNDRFLRRLDKSIIDIQIGDD